MNLQFPRGSFTLLVGPNGSGKTTLLRLLSTYARPQSGKVHWADATGVELRDPADIRARIGYAAHTPLVWDELTVRENLQLQLRLRRKPPEQSTAWLQRLALSAVASERVETLSRGTRQRVGLACALAHEPEFVLLDEPASHLDDASAGLLVDALSGVPRSTTVVLATHEPERFQELADRRVRLTSQGPVEERVA